MIHKLIVFNFCDVDKTLEHTLKNGDNHDNNRLFWLSSQKNLTKLMPMDMFDNNLIPKNHGIIVFDVLNSHLNVK